MSTVSKQILQPRIQEKLFCKKIKKGYLCGTVILVGHLGRVGNSYLSI